MAAYIPVVYDLILQHLEELTITQTEKRPFAFGGYAEVYKATYLGRLVARKVFRIASQDLEKFRRKFAREASVLLIIKHPNVLPLLGYVCDSDIPSLITPYCPNGNIMDYLQKQPGVDKLPLITQLASAVSYLHGLSIIHGDIKGGNTLINEEEKVVLGDYGISRILEKSGFTTSKQSTTLRYAAVELFEERSRVTMATDVWAFGMTVVEVFTGSLPFWYITNDAYVIISVARGDRPKRELCPHINDEIWSMLEKCWDVVPDRRPSMATLSQFFTQEVSRTFPVVTESNRTH